MAIRRDDRSPQAYRQDVDGDLGDMLEAIRAIVFQVNPDADERMKHGMLWYPQIGFLAAQKHYVALYVDPDVLDGFLNRVIDCGKSCIRFHGPDQLDKSVIRELLQASLKTSG